MHLITDTDSLRTFCANLHDTDFITVDTEFMRESTFWPILCLVQVAGPDSYAAIDPMAPGIDLTPLFDLLADESVLKVFHAARQDLEIFLKLTDRIPMPLFDTQVAAMVCGFGESVSYQQLVSNLADQHIDKGSRFTDWSVRPLSDRQIEYALADVTHLRTIYTKLAARLESNGRTPWIEEEMAVLLDHGTYITDPMEAYRRVKGRGGSGRTLAVMRELAAWRELEARKRDMPRNRVLRDETLSEIANQTPRDPDALARSRGLGAKAANGPMGAGILEAVQRGLDTPKADWPEAPIKKDLPRGIGPTSDLLKVLVKKVSSETDVAGKLIATSPEAELIAAFGEKADVRALKGWRREIYGDLALRLRNGEIALGLNGDQLVVIQRLPESSAAE